MSAPGSRILSEGEKGLAGFAALTREPANNILSISTTKNLANLLCIRLVYPEIAIFI